MNWFQAYTYIHMYGYGSMEKHGRDSDLIEKQYGDPDL